MAESDENTTPSTAADAATGTATDTTTAVAADAAAGAGTGTPTITATHGVALRRALLRRLPRLEHEAGSMLADLALDRDHDLRGAIELDVDAFLVPLAATRPRDRR